MSEDWKRVGRAIEARRRELRLSKAEVQRLARVSQPTLDGYLAGAPIRWPDKARGLCEALRWTPDSIDRLAGGGDAISQEATFDDLEHRLMKQLRSSNDELSARLQRQEAVVDELTTQVEELHRLLGDLRAALRGPDERSAPSRPH